MTEEQRLAVIANAYRESKGLPTNSSVLELVADLQAEQLVVEHGLKMSREMTLQMKLSSYLLMSLKILMRKMKKSDYPMK